LKELDKGKYWVKVEIGLEPRGNHGDGINNRGQVKPDEDDYRKDLLGIPEKYA